MAKETLFLSGVSGFLGHNLALALESKYHIIGLHRTRSKLPNLGKITLCNLEKTSLESLFSRYKPSIIIHTATCYGRKNEPLSALIEANIAFTVRLLECAKAHAVRLFINTDTLQSDLLSNYTISKRTVREFLPQFARDFKVANMRIEHIYGLHFDTTQFVPFLLESFAQNAPRIALTKGIQKRDFVYIDDVIRAICVILARESSLQEMSSFEVGSGEFIAVREFVEFLREEFCKYQNIQTKLDFGAIDSRNLGDLSVDLGAIRALGFHPKYRYTQGIARLLELYFSPKNRKRGGVESSFVVAKIALWWDLRESYNSSANLCILARSEKSLNSSTFGKVLSGDFKGCARHTSADRINNSSSEVCEASPLKSPTKQSQMTHPLTPSAREGEVKVSHLRWEDFWQGGVAPLNPQNCNSRESKNFFAYFFSKKVRWRKPKFNNKLSPSLAEGVRGWVNSQNIESLQDSRESHKKHESKTPIDCAKQSLMVAFDLRCGFEGFWEFSARDKTWSLSSVENLSNPSNCTPKAQCQRCVA